MPRAEYQRNLITFAVFQRNEEIAHPFHPKIIEFVLFSTRKNGADGMLRVRQLADNFLLSEFAESLDSLIIRSGVAGNPCSSAEHRIARMP